MNPQGRIRWTPFARPIQAALRENRAIRAALAQLRPADAAHARKAIAAAIAERLERQGRLK